MTGSQEAGVAKSGFYSFGASFSIIGLCFMLSASDQILLLEFSIWMLSKDNDERELDLESFVTD